MKKTFFFYISSLLLSLGIASCNNESDNDQKSTDTLNDGNTSQNTSLARTAQLGENCIGMANVFFIDKNEALKMIEHFKDEFHNKPGLPNAMDKFKDSIWIDSSVIKAFSDFLTANASDYDGLRIISVTYENDSSDIFLVLTTASGTGHRERWEAYVPVSGSPVFRNYNVSENIVSPLIDRFRTLCRNQTDPRNISSTTFDSLSAKIWLSSCVFNLLSDTIQRSEGKLDGVMVYFAAYDKTDVTRAGFQKRDNQSTVILVPTNPSKGGHKPDWDAIKTQIQNLKMFPIAGAFNHGELCPNACN